METGFLSTDVLALAISRRYNDEKISREHQADDIAPINLIPG